MEHEFIITDLTQMQGERVCVAGVDHKNQQIRIDLPPPGIFQQHLYLHDQQIIRPRAVVNLSVHTAPDRIAPHVEDFDWDRHGANQVLRIATEASWRQVLEKTTFPSVEAIFETTLHHKKNITPGTGVRSLGTIKPQTIDWVDYRVLQTPEGEKHGYRIRFTDATGTRYPEITITDLTFRYYVHALERKRREDGVRTVIAKKLKNSEVWLRLGLTRPWQGWCWLQVNGIYTFPDYLDGQTFDDFRKQGIRLPN